MKLIETKTTILLECSFKKLQKILLSENVILNRYEKDHANTLLVRSVKEHFLQFAEKNDKIKFINNGYGQFKALEISTTGERIPAQKVFTLLENAGVK